MIMMDADDIAYCFPCILCDIHVDRLPLARIVIVKVVLSLAIVWKWSLV